MTVSILCIGNELLSGRTLNTNAAWLGRSLTDLGCTINKQIVIADEEDFILDTLDNLIDENEDCVIITGGLGPTDDDITRESLFKYVGAQSIFDTEYWRELSKRFRKFGMEIPESNRCQALVPDIGEVIDNPIGSARGFKFKVSKTTLFSLPGVPSEMKAMTTSFIIPYVKQHTNQNICSKTIRTTGLPESALIELINEPIRSDHQCEIGYYPSLFGVDIRVTSEKDAHMETLSKVLESLLGQYVFGFDDDKIEDIVVRLAIEKNISLSFAESCTGGLIGHRITQVPGSSKVFRGSLVVYSNDAKVNILGVDKENIEKYGAVSEPTSKDMAEKIRSKFSTDIGLSITGIAGPDGGSETKPVGLTYIGLSTSEGVKVREYNFGSNRLNNKSRASQSALNFLRLEMYEA